MPCEWRAAYRLLKGAGFAPEWVMLGRRIEEWRSRLQAARSAAQADGIAALNKAIDHYNLRVPHALFQKLKVRV